MKKLYNLFALALMLVLTLGFASACHCGDGWVYTPNGEQCDDGNTLSNDGCSLNCQIEYCGDGILQTSEGCDDGNTLSNDGCSSICTPESCGNGIIEGTEQCDDGNLEAGDGCTTNCTIDTPTVPEFGTMIGILTALGALGTFFVIRRK